MTITENWRLTFRVSKTGTLLDMTLEDYCVSRQSVSALLNDRARLSADMAIRFEKAFGISAEILMRTQNMFDLAQARVHKNDLEVTGFFALAQESAGYRVSQ